MGKSKKGTSHAGPHKKHGPKRHMFKEYKPMIYAISKSNILDKYHNFESFMLSCQARGLKVGGMDEWKERFKFFTQDLKTRQEQDEWLKNCKNYKETTPKTKKAQ